MMEINTATMNGAGNMATRNRRLSDAELDQAIEGTSLALSYLKGRGDSEIVCFALRSDLGVFKNVKEERKK